MTVFPPVQQTYPYSNFLNASGTLAPAVVGKKIVANIVVAMEVFEANTTASSYVYVTVASTHNTVTVTRTYFIQCGVADSTVSEVIPLPKDLECDVDTGITVTITPTGNAFTTVDIGYYLK